MKKKNYIVEYQYNNGDPRFTKVKAVQAPKLPRFVVPKSMMSRIYLDKKHKAAADRRSLNRISYDD